MNKIGIIISGNHPKLILDGIKTQTRRVMKPQPIPHPNIEVSAIKKQILSGIKGKFIYWQDQHTGKTFYCPYGQVGDQLWVRETWATLGSLDNLSPCELDRHTSPIFFRTDSEDFPMYFDKGKWRPSIFMPRWASRITLEITKIRVERVQDISEEDAKAEGIESLKPSMCCYTNRYCFQVLWDSLNAKRDYSWEVNPWVWIISFRRIEP